jgi:hypothetical protein
MANQVEIALQLRRFIDTLPKPRGLDEEKAQPEYFRALAQFTNAEITEAVDRRLSGGFPDIRTTAYPRVPEFADLCKRVRAEHAKVEHERNRAKEITKEREEFTFRKKTPDEIERAKVKLQEYEESRLAANLEATKSLGGKATNLAEELREAAVRRRRYGMTEDRLNAIPDRAVPDDMQRIGELMRDLPPAPPGTEPKPVDVDDQDKRGMAALKTNQDMRKAAMG